MVAIGALLLTLKLSNKLLMGNIFHTALCNNSRFDYRLFVCLFATGKPQNAIQSALCNSHHHAISCYPY